MSDLSDYDKELLYVSVFETSRLRGALLWLELRLWWVSESGVLGWLGDRCDDMETALKRRRARRNLRRRRAAQP